jgi:dephospho-CoA kinase
MSSPSRQPQTNRLVIGIAGRIGAGKTSAATHLSSKHDFQYLRYSQVLADWLATDLEKKARLQEIGWEVMKGGKQSELNSRLIAQIKPDIDVAVDGLRHPIDFDSLKDFSPESFRLVYIETPSKLRWEHLKGHSRYADFASFQAADSHPVEQRIEALRTIAARVLRNESTLETFRSELDAAIREFRVGGRV